MRPQTTPGELLRLAGAHLRSLQPAMKTHFSLGGWPYRVRFDYPGCVLVSDGVSGELLARSRPGRPTTPASVRRVPR